MKRFFSLAAVGLISSIAGAAGSSASAQSYEYRYQSTVRGSPSGGSPANCTTPWGAFVTHTQDVAAFLASSVPFGQLCQSEQRVCNDGSLSGTFANAGCVVEAPLAQCDLPWGGQIASGASVEAYLTADVEFGVSCVSETRSCSDGTLAGSMVNQTCVVAAQDLTPASFALTPATNVTPGNFAYTFITLVSGVTGDVPISISDFDHEASLQICLDSNCVQVVQPWAAAATTIRDGQYFQMRFRSSTSLATGRTKSISVGTFSTNFTATTTATYCGGVGRRCEDGSVFIGSNGGVAMFAAACDFGQTWNGSACVGSRDMSRTFGVVGETIRTICSNGSQVTCETGRENTEALVAAGPAYQVAASCAGLSQHGHDDWYLPARNEFQRMMEQSNGPGLAGSFNQNQGTYYFTSSELSTTNAVIWHAYPAPNGAVSSIGRAYVPSPSVPVYTRCLRSVG